MKYSTALVLAVVLHGVVLLATYLNIPETSPTPQPVLATAASKPIIQATAIDSSQVQAEVTRLKQQQLNKVAVEKKREIDARAELDKIKNQRIHEQERAKQAKADLVKIEKTQRETELLASAEAERIKLTAQRQQIIRYKVLITQALSQHWIRPLETKLNETSEYKIRLDKNGSVLSAQLTKSSGNPALDRSARNAIYKASPLPVPKDPELFVEFRELTLTVRPEGFIARG